MTLPTQAEIKGLVTQLKKAPWPDISARLEAAVKRERQVDTVADGYPRSTLGGGGGGGTLIDPDRPELGSVKLTSVEGAGLARLRSDKQSKWTTSASDKVRLAATLVQQVIGLLDLIDEDRGVERIVPPGCQWCDEAGVTEQGVTGLDRETGKAKGDPVPWAHRTSYLNQQVFLCKPHYRYLDEQAGKPTTEQTRWHAEHGRWRVRQAG